ncbi:MAG: hypothetical protein JST19_02040 [Bacteroidetes bacterium]|nr:hypothetical protein [Bacteroidota bacterium]
MAPRAEKMELEFNNGTGGLIASLQQMLEFISGRIPSGADAEDILFRSKVIITELLTNAIKHAGKGTTLFEIESSACLSIRKTDKGAPLYLVTDNDHPAGSGSNNKKLISADPLNALFAIRENENRVRFTSEESSMDDFLSVEQVMEHFGLLIIARSSDEFTYTYHNDTGSNVFSVSLNWYAEN